jgi:hypothetical protein
MLLDLGKQPRMARPGHCIPSVTLYSTQNEIKSSFDVASKSWLCRTCGEEFNLLESMGSLDCHQHPGHVQDDERWSCCGQRLYPMRWLPSRDIQRLYPNKWVCHPVAVRGCQKCDHNTSDKPYTHQDQQSLATLSALLPFMNKEFPFALRKGFDAGVLRRCAVRPLHLPPSPIGTTVYYQDDDGNPQQKIVDGTPNVSTGMELYAVAEDGHRVRRWWSTTTK